MYYMTEEKRRRARAAHKRWYLKDIEERRRKKRENYRKNKINLYVRDRRRAIQEATSGRPKPKCCDVCGDDSTRIEFDHCHQRGVFRGWLCNHCNIILGRAHDDPDYLRKLIAYLERTKDFVPAQLTLPGI